MDIDWTLLVLALAGLSLVLGLWIQFRRQRRMAEELGRLGEEVGRLAGDLAGLCKSSVGAGERLVRLEQRVQRLTERLDQTELRTAGDRPYAHAVKLVQNGAGVEELIESCGLTRGEADLIVMLHGVAQAS